ncbi:MAG TPA: NAD(P)/FAD-dependent oxidoreductase [Marmoricola sp.]|nr:NAD(P)/FAD-dependent oxidoreductase [Marmoricola sp.]
MRTLISGAGISGLALANLLQRQGHSPVVIDRRAPDADDGYGLALWPHGTRVFHALGIHDEFVARSEPMGSYVARSGSGHELTSSPMPASVHRYGHLGIIARADLLAMLRAPLGDTDIRAGVTVERLQQSEDQVDVELDDGTTATFDLVVGTDGIHSRIRDLLLGRVPDRDTGWGCYVWWADRRLVAGTETTEHWGAGSFLGTYPCRDRVCVILGAPVDVLRPDHPHGRTDRLSALLERFRVPVAEYTADLPSDTEPLFLWPMADVRAPAWVRGRTALVGDAAAAFLPTAGIGASMALESAAALADELSRTDATYLPNALKLYERRRRSRVEAAQTQSRRLARVMFVRNRRLAAVRNRALTHARIEQLVGPLIKELQEPI